MFEDEGPGGAAAGLTPLCVLLTLMREKWAAGDREGAASFAKLAAPYVHGRRAQEAERSSPDVRRMPDAELVARLGRMAAVDEPETHPELLPVLGRSRAGG